MRLRGVFGSSTGSAIQTGGDIARNDPGRLQPALGSTSVSE